MNHKNTSTSSIQYILIQKKIFKNNIILFPIEDTNSIFHTIQEYPRDFMQFHDQKLFFEISKSVSQINPALNLLLFDESFFQAEINPILFYNNFLGLQHRVVVYIIDVNVKNIDLIFEGIKKSKQKHWYFCFYGHTPTAPDVEADYSKYFNSVQHLLQHFKNDFDSIKKMFSDRSEGYHELKFSLDETSNEIENLDFNPIIPNYTTLIQISNPSWKVEQPHKRANNRDKRNSELLKIVKEIDAIHLSTKVIGANYGTLPILVATFPFYNPTVKTHLKSRIKNDLHKLYSHFYGLEQQMDYTYVFETRSLDDEEIEHVGNAVMENLLKPKLLFLDAISYLQSSFTFSPVLRLPLVGKSVYKELSMFNPANKNFITRQALRKISKPLLGFGEKLSSLTFDTDTKEYLKTRSGQLFVISDLPIEWLTMDRVPLCYSHDVCRIPEANYQGLINNFSANNRFDYEIDENIVERTLIILSGDVEKSGNHDFTESYKSIKENAAKLNYHYRYCNTIENVANAIKEIEPYILIFDCHGNIEDSTQPSYLTIGDEKLTGAKIVEHRISAPIVFLSCCNTSPNYGYINQLHDAFFQVGAITITGTFLPITIKRGTLYYLRLLFLLEKDAKQNLHENWLSFISSGIRTSLIHDFMTKSYHKLNRSLTNEEAQALSKLLQDIHIFDKRREVFLQLLDKGLEISPELTITIEDTDCEFLMYTHYGRPDLVLFKNSKTELNE